MMNYLIIGLGGGSGAIMRVLLEKALPSKLMNIPAGILIINILGCFIAGIISGLQNFGVFLSDSVKYFLVSGFLGGFTTFSAFSLELGFLYEKHFYGTAVTYGILSVAMSIGFFFLGVRLVK